MTRLTTSLPVSASSKARRTDGGHGRRVVGPAASCRVVSCRVDRRSRLGPLLTAPPGRSGRHSRTRPARSVALAGFGLALLYKGAVLWPWWTSPPPHPPRLGPGIGTRALAIAGTSAQHYRLAIRPGSLLVTPSGVERFLG